MATPTAEEKRKLAKLGIAMPDGSFYIRNQAELSDAIKAVGRATPNAGESEVERRNSVRRHIMKRASALKLQSMIPDTWNSDGSLKQSAMGEQICEDFLIHFGRKGMKWGEHRFGRDRGTSSSSSVSSDAQRASDLKRIVSKHGTSALSNQDLQHLVTRLNLERQHGQLNPAKVSAGQKITHEILKFGGDVAKQQATAYASKYAGKGIEHLLKKAA